MPRVLTIGVVLWACAVLVTVNGAQRRQRGRRTPVRTVATNNPYSTFTHLTHGPDSPDTRTKLLKCGDCHTSPSPNEVNRTAAGLADPLQRHLYHDACFSCHERQVFRGARPAICTICHTRVSPRATARDVYEWRFVSAKFSHIGGGENRRHVAECTSCHKTDGETPRVKFPAAPIAACFQCHKSNKPKIVTEMDNYQEIMEGRAEGNPECTGCHLSVVGRLAPPCSHYFLFGEDYFAVEDFPKSAKQLEARCKK